ncbi:hypothetical protein BRD00_07890 [Halobacteriales archaeon QS_8_69_26]|nr:MAG: hypothetical protein BRD00_07890 [Halobacteriales archaeon QS_8_69_26]
MSAKGIEEDRVLDDRVEELAASERVAFDDVVEFLVALPDEETVEHRIDVENLVARVPGAVEHLRELLAREGLVFEDANATTVRFGAFLALQAHYRRQRDVAAMERLHEEYDHLFSDRPMYEAARAQLLRVRGGQDDHERAVRAFESVVEEAPDDPWLQHNLAETIVEGLEDDVLPAADRGKYRRQAREAVDRALERRPEHGPYHVTRGRVLALSGEFDRARAEIERGIHLTDAGEEGYALRTARFQRHLLGVEIREAEERFGTRIEDAEERIDDLERRSEAAIEDVRAETDEAIEELRAESDEVAEDLRSRADGTLEDLHRRAEGVRDGFRNASLQFLGFFTAVLAAVVTTVQIATSYGPRPAGALILMVFGGLTASMGAFAGLVADEDGPGRPEATMVLAGIGLLALGYAALLVG